MRLGFWTQKFIIEKSSFFCEKGEISQIHVCDFHLQGLGLTPQPPEDHPPALDQCSPLLREDPHHTRVSGLNDKIKTMQVAYGIPDIGHISHTGIGWH